MTYLSITKHRGDRPDGDVYHIFEVSSIMSLLEELPEEIQHLESIIQEARNELSNKTVIHSRENGTQ